MSLIESLLYSNSNPSMTKPINMEIGIIICTSTKKGRKCHFANVKNNEFLNYFAKLPSTGLIAVSFADLILSSITSLPSMAPNIHMCFNF